MGRAREGTWFIGGLRCHHKEKFPRDIVIASCNKGGENWQNMRMEVKVVPPQDLEDYLVVAPAPIIPFSTSYPMHRNESGTDMSPNTVWQPALEREI